MTSINVLITDNVFVSFFRISFRVQFTTTIVHFNRSDVNSPARNSFFILLDQTIENFFLRELGPITLLLYRKIKVSPLSEGPDFYRLCRAMAFLEP